MQQLTMDEVRNSEGSGIRNRGRLPSGSENNTKDTQQEEPQCKEAIKEEEKGF